MNKNIKAYWDQYQPKNETEEAGMLFQLATLQSYQYGKATWQEINLEEKLWVIPASHDKTREQRNIPLSPIALLALSKLSNNHPEDHILEGIPSLNHKETRRIAFEVLVANGTKADTMDKIFAHKKFEGDDDLGDIHYAMQLWSGMIYLLCSSKQGTDEQPSVQAKDDKETKIPTELAITIKKVTTEERQRLLENLDDLTLSGGACNEVWKTFNFVLSTVEGCNSLLERPDVLIKGIINARKLLSLEAIETTDS